MSRHGSGGVEHSGDANNFIFAVVCVSADRFSPDSSLVADGFSQLTERMQLYHQSILKHIRRKS